MSQILLFFLAGIPEWFICSEVCLWGSWSPQAYCQFFSWIGQLISYELSNWVRCGKGIMLILTLVVLIWCYCQECFKWSQNVNQLYCGLYLDLAWRSAFCMGWLYGLGCLFSHYMDKWLFRRVSKFHASSDPNRQNVGYGALNVRIWCFLDNVDSLHGLVA